jgi:hypothetical protein
MAVIMVNITEGKEYSTANENLFAMDGWMDVNMIFGSRHIN